MTPINIFKITSEKENFEKSDYIAISSFRSLLPIDIQDIMLFFGKGSFNNKMALLPPSIWRFETHRADATTIGPNIGESYSGVVHGVQIGGTDIGDKIICCEGGGGIVFASRLFGGFVNIGHSLNEAITSIFHPVFGDVLKASRLYFDSVRNRHDVVFIPKERTRSDLHEALSGLGIYQKFENECDACYYFPSHEVMISFQEELDNTYGSHLNICMAPQSINSHFCSLVRDALMRLGCHTSRPNPQVSSESESGVDECA